MSKKILLAVVGPGLIGLKHIQLIAKNPQSLLCALVAPNDDHNVLIAQSYNVPLFSSIEELHESVQVDGMIISSPNIFHFEQAKFCIEKNIPILIEKPICDNYKDGLVLLELIKKRNSKVLIGHHRSYSNIIRTAKNIINSGKIGNIVSITGSAQFYKPDKYFEESPWRTKPGGGPILINLIHEISNFRALCGEIEYVQAMLSKNIRRGQVEDTAVVNFRFINGVLGNLMLSDTAASSKSWEQTSGENLNFPQYKEDDCYLICGTKGSFTVPSMKLKYYESSSTSSWLQPFKEDKILYIKNDPLDEQLTHFINLIKNNIMPIVSAADGLKNLQMIEAIYRSGLSGNTVKIENLVNVEMIMSVK